MKEKIIEFLSIHNFSQRESEIFREILLGESTDAKTIAKKFGISANTVRIHCKNINSRLGTDSKSNAMQIFIRYLNHSI